MGGGGGGGGGEKRYILPSYGSHQLLHVYSRPAALNLRMNEGFSLLMEERVAARVIRPINR